MDVVTQRQLACPAKLPEDHRVVAASEGSPTAERPDGQLLRVQPNGQLVATNLVQRAQFYLDIERC